MARTDKLADDGGELEMEYQSATILICIQIPTYIRISCLDSTEKFAVSCGCHHFVIEVFHLLCFVLCCVLNFISAVFNRLWAQSAIDHCNLYHLWRTVFLVSQLRL